MNCRPLRYTETKGYYFFMYSPTGRIVRGWRRAMPPTPEFCVGDTNMLVSWSQHNPLIYVLPDAKPKICIIPDAKPRRQSVKYRWCWAFWRWPCIFHVYFMYISCCLCIFHVGYVRISRRKGRFHWNTGLTLNCHVIQVLIFNQGTIFEAS